MKMNAVPRIPEQTPSLSRRTFLGFSAASAALVAFPALLSACSSDSSSGGKKTTVRFWTWYTQQKDEFPKLIAAFEKANPTIHIENRLFGGPNDYLPAMQAAVSAGDPPEIFAPHVYALEYGKAGVLADLKQELGESFLSDFFDSANQEYTTGGKQYGLGWMAQTFGLYYNPDIFARAGVQVHETWDDLITISQTIKQKTGLIPCAFANNPANTDFLFPFITQAADDPTLLLKLDAQTDGSSWNSPYVVQGLQKMDTIIKAGVFNPNSSGVQTPQAEASFYNGQAAMMFQGSWGPQDFAQNAPASFVKLYKVAKTPALAKGGKHWCANQAGAGLSVSALSKNKAAAIEFIKFLYDPTRYTSTMNTTNSMPATKSAAAQVQDPILKDMTSWLINGEGSPHIMFGKGTNDAVSSAVDAIFAGTVTPQQAAANIQDSVKRAQGR